MSSFARRACMGALIVGLFVAVPWAYGLHADHAQIPRQPLRTSDFGTRLQNYAASDEDFVEDLYARFAGHHEPAQIPDVFTTEILDVNALGVAEVYAVHDTVGIYWKDGVDAEDIAAELRKKGWERIGATDAGSTYLKSDGAARWLYMSVFTVGQATSAVFFYDKKGQ